jgi:flagellar biosynthesis/type III secretory pathway protein FliH
MAAPGKNLQKYTFDTEFFELVGQPGVESGAKLPPNSTRHVEAIKQQAYEDGFTAGIQEGQKQAQADLALLQQNMQNTLMALQNSLQERENVLQTQLLSLMVRLIEALVGHAGRHYAPEILEHHLRQLLPLVKTDEQLTLRIHPSARGYHEKLQLPQASILGLTMRVIPDSTLGAVDAVIEWANGGVESRLEEHTQALQAFFQAVGTHALPPVSLTEAADVPVSLAAPVAMATPNPMPAPVSVPIAPTAADEATAAARARAAALLGDDELVDALK